MKNRIIAIAVTFSAIVLYARTLDDLASSLIADKHKEQEARQKAEEARQQERRRKEAEARQSKLEAEKMRQEIEAEKHRQIAAAESEAERRRRHPIEQKKRGEYAQALLSSISFDVESYFGIQRSLRKYLYSVGVTEKRWRQLQDLQAHKDWLGMLQTISEGEMSEYPPQAQIRALVDGFKGETFHAELLFTHHGDGNSLWGGYYIVGAEMDMERNWMRRQRWQNDEARLVVAFSTENGKRGFIFSEKSKPDEEALLRSRERAITTLREDKRLGRISQGEAEEKSKQIDEQFRQDFTAWMETSSIPNNAYPVKVRDKAKTSTGRAAVGEKTKWIKCPDCEGEKYISKGKCKECNGQGWYLTPVTRGIGGRAMGGRKRQCTKCNGKGEIKEQCKKCRGRGRVKQQ